MLARILLSLVLLSLVACGNNARAPVEDRVPEPTQTEHRVARGDTLYSIAFRYGLDYRKVAAANSIGSPYTIYPGQSIRLEEAALPVASRPTEPLQPIEAPQPMEPQPMEPQPMEPQPMEAPQPVKSKPSPAPTSSTPPVPAPVTTSVATPPKPVTKPAPPVAASKPAPPGGAGGKVTAWRWPTKGPITRGYSTSVHKGIDIGGSRGDPVVAVAAGSVVYAGTGIVGFGELLIVKHNDVYLSAYGHNDALLVSEGDRVAAGETIAHKGSSGTDKVKLHFEIRKAGKPIDPQRVLPRR